MSAFHRNSGIDSAKKGKESIQTDTEILTVWE